MARSPCACMRAVAVRCACAAWVRALAACAQHATDIVTVPFHCVHGICAVHGFLCTVHTKT